MSYPAIYPSLMSAVGNVYKGGLDNTEQLRDFGSKHSDEDADLPLRKFDKHLRGIPEPGAVQPGCKFPI